MAVLKKDYLIYDCHRCVIFRKFNNAKTGKRVGREKDDKIKNDDGHLLKNEAETFIPLEIAYIISYSLINISSGKTELIYSYYI